MIENRLQVEKVATFYQFSKFFNIQSLQKTTLGYIEHCFTAVVEVNNFSELYYTLVLRILASAGLLVTSELEVMNAANK